MGAARMPAARCAPGGQNRPPVPRLFSFSPARERPHAGQGGEPRRALIPLGFVCSLHAQEHEYV